MLQSMQSIQQPHTNALSSGEVNINLTQTERDARIRSIDTQLNAAKTRYNLAKKQYSEASSEIIKFAASMTMAITTLEINNLKQERVYWLGQPVDSFAANDAAEITAQKESSGIADPKFINNVPENNSDNGTLEFTLLGRFIIWMANLFMPLFVNIKSDNVPNLA